MTLSEKTRAENMLHGTNPETAIVRVRAFVEATRDTPEAMNLLAIAHKDSVVPGVTTVAPLFRSDVEALLERYSQIGREGPHDGSTASAVIIEIPTVELLPPEGQHEPE